MQQDEITQLAEKNIRTIYEREQAERKRAPITHKIAHKVAAFSGTVLFIGLNAVIFAVWILINVLTPYKFDPYPFTFLTMAVSLESIFLSTFVLISQNAMAEHTERRHNLDLQINLLAEEESTELIKVVLLMARKMDIPDKELVRLEALANDTDPEQVLEKISEIESETE